MYNLATMWLTLSVIFFLCEYVTGLLQVVTLGGLVAGSFIEGAFMCLGLKLMHVIVDKQFRMAELPQMLQYRGDCVKALLVAAAFSLEGVVTVCRMLPGYDLNFGIMHGIFLLLLYPAAAIVMDKLMLKEQMEHAN
ncbi:hypothetical protein [uncultured Phascolarctobacterium sp.]|uniref:hypothetical protein n=1 Tax=uncultured Phascolarctobacterium sp. TaxID=512296 RepID=UPI0025EDD32E|nr:hypothetical protein [uncultured Phascolarctobacterium sp.]